MIKAANLCTAFFPMGTGGSNLQRTIGLKAPLPRALGEPALFPYELGRRGGVGDAWHGRRRRVRSAVDASMRACGDDAGRAGLRQARSRKYHRPMAAIMALQKPATHESPKK